MTNRKWDMRPENQPKIQYYDIVYYDYYILNTNNTNDWTPNPYT